MRNLAIVTRTDGLWRVLELAGELDFGTAPQLHDAVRAEELGPDHGLVIDLAGLTFCDSSGITAMLVAQKLTAATGASLALAAVPGRVARTFKLAGLEQVFAIHSTAAEVTVRDLS